MLTFISIFFLISIGVVDNVRDSMAMVLVEDETNKEDTAKSLKKEENIKESSFFLQPKNELWIKLNPDYDDEDSYNYRKPGEALLEFDQNMELAANSRFCFQIVGVIENGDNIENFLQCTEEVPKTQFLLEDLHRGVYNITARIEELENDVVVREETRAIIVRPPIRFNPTYEWTKIPTKFHSIPPGLEVEMDVFTGKGSIVRIPPRWSLRIFIPKFRTTSLTEEGKDEEVLFKMFYMDVDRTTKVAEVIQAVEAHIGAETGCVSFTNSLTSETIERGLSVEEVDWFNLRFAYLPTISDSCRINVCATGVYSDDSTCLKSNIYE